MKDILLEHSRQVWGGAGREDRHTQTHTDCYSKHILNWPIIHGNENVYLIITVCKQKKALLLLLKVTCLNLCQFKET